MSDRDLLDLDEDLLADGPDAPVGEWDDDLLDDFPADDPAADAEACAPPPPAATPPAEKPAAPRPKVAATPRRRASRRRGPSGHGAAAAASLFVVGAALCLGAGVLMASGADPVALLDFSGFADPMTAWDLAAHPVNAFWLGVVATVAVALLAGASMRRRFAGVRDDLAGRERVLEAVRRLDPEDAASWRQDALNDDPDVAAVASALLGHANLQQAKLERYVGLEGELHRLEKAMADEDADALGAAWDSPVAGSVADQAVRLVHACREAVDAAARSRSELAEQGPDLVAGLRDARRWQTTAASQLKVQGAGSERLFRRLGKVDPAAGDPRADDRMQELRQAMEAVLRDCAVAEPAAESHGGVAAEVADRTGRLAFRIAMEVARLGAQGERLLPLTQDLEGLVGDIRALAGAGGGTDPVALLEKVRDGLAQVDLASLASGSGHAGAEALAELTPQAGEVAAGLASLAKDVAAQSRRLDELLDLAAAMTGIDVPRGGHESADTPDGMLVDRFDPFGDDADEPLVADPFASGGGSIFSPDATPGNGFDRAVLPGQDDAAAGEPAASDLPLVNGFGVTAEPAAPQPGLPESTEKVYDLAEFDAQPLDDAAADGPAGEVHDLSEFGAVRME